MALFGKSRDISLFNSVNGELINDLIQTEVAYYKFVLEQTSANVYGESLGKNYYEPMKVACLILRSDQEWSTETADHGASFSIIVTAHQSRVEKLNLIPLRGGVYPTTNKLDGGIANLSK